MKNRTIIMMAMSAAALVSCSDWTQPESIKIKVASLEKDAPEVYAEYCRALRDYKASDHKLMYVCFDNQVNAGDQSYNLASLPDSVDVVELSNPENVNSALVAQMTKLRSDKAFKFAVEFSYDNVKTEYDDSVLALRTAYEAERDTVAAHGGDPDTVAEPAYPVFAQMLKAGLDEVFGYVDAYGLDIVRVKYSDLKSRVHLTDEEDSAYVAAQTAAFDAILEEFTARKGVGMYLNARAEFIVAEGVVDAAEYVILPTEDLFGTVDMAQMAVGTAREYPEARLLYAISSALSDFSAGWFNNKTLEQIPTASRWVVDSDSFDKSGLVIYDARRTFYDTNRRVYSKLHNAIKVMNPNS